jgi:hypothetical protein
MPRRQTPREVFEDLLNRLDPSIREAFERAIRDIQRAVDYQRLVAEIAAGNIEAALNALGIDATAFEPMLDAIRDSYTESGRTTVEGLPRQLATFRFSARNHRAEQWLRDHGAELVRQITADQRLAIRDVLEAQTRAGSAPRSIATAVVGRMNPATGAREGGIIGLTRDQASYVTTARDELSSGDVARLRNYLQRARRDKRFDRTVQKAIRDGTRIPADTARKMAVAYERRLLELRGQTIGRTEAMAAIHEAQWEALRQAVDAGIIAENQIKRVWRSAGDVRVRDTHRAINGDSVGLRESFVSPSGARLRFPGDPLAPIAERANCRCWAETRIDFFANVR